MEIRDKIVDAIIKEIIGPSPNPNYIDAETGEEILLARVHGSPKSRYGAGMLYPQATPNLEVDDPGTKEGEESYKPDSIPDVEDSIEIPEPSNLKTPHGDTEFEEPVGLANQYLQSAMGFTIRFKKNEKDDTVWLNFCSAHYVKRKDKKAVKRVST